MGTYNLGDEGDSDKETDAALRATLIVIGADISRSGVAVEMEGSKYLGR